MTTPTQEVCNAVTMLLPALVFAREAALRWPNPWLVCLLGGSVMHAPALVAYHLRAASIKRQEDCRLSKAENGNSQLLKVERQHVNSVENCVGFRV